MSSLHITNGGKKCPRKISNVHCTIASMIILNYRYSCILSGYSGIKLAIIILLYTGCIFSSSGVSVVKILQTFVSILSQYTNTPK